jgi:hypothetical protein
VNDTRGLKPLQQFVAAEARSLMQYMLGVFPWADSRHVEAVNRLLGLIEAERDALAILTRCLYRHKLPPPHAGGYPVDFTSLNFVDLGHLLPLVARHEEESVARLRQAVAATHDDEARQLAQALLDLKLKHLEDLRQLAQPQAAVTS